MSVCPLVWGALAFGVVGTLGRRSSRDAKWPRRAWLVLCLATAAIGLAVSLSSSLADACGFDEFARRAALPIGLWAMAFGWTRQDAGQFGRGGMIVGGLLLAATTADLIGLTFGLVLVALGSRRKGDDATAFLDRMAWIASGVGAGGCLGALGTTDLAAIRDALDLAYTPSEPLIPIGRPALVILGSVAVWMIGAMASIGARCAPTLHDDGEPLEQRLADVTARGLVAMLGLSRWIATGLPGLNGVLVTLSLLLSLVAGAAAAWALSDRQRLDRRMMGLALWLFSGQLLWLTALVEPESSALAWRWLPLGIGHDLAVLAAITAAMHGWVGRASPMAYLDELRGMATIRPWSAILVGVPLVSLLGGPLVAGFWLKLTMASQLFAMHGPGPDDLAWPRTDVRIALGLWGVTWIVAARSAVDLARLMLLETPLGSDAPPRRPWSTTIAWSIGLTIVILGLSPSLLSRWAGP
jgi:hypothetical protein